MIKKIIIFITKNIFLLVLRVKKNSQNKSISYKDLNFKQNDFTNYKLIKQYILKEKFINNTSIIDIHTFNFLIFFQKIGGKKGIDLSKKSIFNWFKKYKNYINFPWSKDLSAKRFLNIVYNYDFIYSTLTNKEIKKINEIVSFHRNRFLFDIFRKNNEDISSVELVALVLIKCINNEVDESILKKVEEVIESQTDEISMHKSYNILEHAKFINSLNEIKNILLFFKIKIPEKIFYMILAMTSLLSKYKHDDLSLPLFNGCNNNHNILIENIKKAEPFLKTRNFKNFINGVALYKDNNKVVFFDVVQPTSYGYSEDLCAGSLSIEVSALKEKIITNCGGAEITGKNPAYLKYTAAHSTIVINNTNVTEIKEGERKKIFPKQVIFEQREDDDDIYLIGTHNSYLKNYGIICKRELHISKSKNLIKGEDTIISSKSNNEKTLYHIRFHMLPNSSSTITKNKKSVIIKTNKNNIWVFKTSLEVSIEKSIFVQNDVAKESKQIVISNTISSIKNKVLWSLEKR